MNRYTPGVVLHIWHGDLADRDYRNRYQILLDNDYARDGGVLSAAAEPSPDPSRKRPHRRRTRTCASTASREAQ